MFIDDNGYHVYECKDGRLRCYNPETHKVVSYPRVLVEENLGYQLKPYEQVHHEDEDPLNNDPSNLSVKNLGEHQKMHMPNKYYDKEMTCPYCNEKFIWSAKSQREFYKNIKRRPNAAGPFCSKSCAGSYSRQEQLRRDS